MTTAPLFVYPKQCLHCHQWIVEQRLCPLADQDVLVATEKEILKFSAGVVHVNCPKLPPVPFLPTPSPLQLTTQKRQLQEAGKALISKAGFDPLEYSSMSSNSTNTPLNLMNTNRSVEARSRANVALLPGSYMSRFQAANQALAVQAQKPQELSSDIDYKKLSEIKKSLEELVTVPGATMDQYMKTGLTWLHMKQLLGDSRNSKQNNYYILRLFVEHLGFNYSHLIKFFELANVRALGEVILRKEIDFSHAEWALLRVNKDATGGAISFTSLGITYVQWMNIRES